MKISQKEALKLIDDKLLQFQKVLDKTTYDNRYNEAYQIAYHGTQNLLTELFSSTEASKFRGNTISGSVRTIAETSAQRQIQLQHYKRHVSNCITHLKIYRERIQKFGQMIKKKGVKNQ